MVEQKTEPMFQGTFTALVTPFSGRDVDWASLDKLVDAQLEAGIDGVVPCGTTGESPTLTHDEHSRVIEAVVKRVGGRCKVIAGSGSNATQEAVFRTRHAAGAGADGALLVAPYYNRPTQEGLYRHYMTIAEAADIPIVLYNVPFRCGVDIHNDTVVRLREGCANIVAIKDASGDVNRSADLANRSDISVLSGDDSLTLPMMVHGAVGVISVVSNLVPAWMKEMVDAAAAGDFVRARSLHRRVCILADELTSFGPNPIPIKSAMALRDMVSDEFRLPMCSLDEESRGRLNELLKRYEL
jgi:4-hydroxy-tetrahydrodipicolinate synthase